jgi:DNA-binding phage protein
MYFEETDMDATRLSKRTLEALEKMPPDKRIRLQAVIARTQTAEARAKSASDRDILDREYRETGRIATIGEKANPEDSVLFRHFVKSLRAERLSRRLSLDQIAVRSKLDKAALSRLQAGKQVNPTVTTLMRYARALDMRMTFFLQSPSGGSEGTPQRSASPSRAKRRQ